MRISKVGWRVVCAILCVCVASTRTYTVYVINPQTYVPKVIETEQAYREADDLNRGDDYGSKFIPIKSPRVDHRLATLPLDPDAEMLPAHYTGVKPPGVDHMELKYAVPQVAKGSPESQSLRKSDQAGGSRHASAKQEGSVQDVREGRRKVVSSERGQKGDRRKEKKKTEYSEDGGKRTSHSDGGGSSRRDKERDEYNKDHDFYDNDDQGGHSKKHGRYKEKHVATEGTYKKGASTDSGDDEAEDHKKGIAVNSQAEQESKGHVAGRGYDEVFKNFQGFAKQADRAEGKKFGFAEAKAR
ncbi:PREDICTED: nuclear speckle splicing regulatory protein 1-like [Dufourea novaeangliae]|uniref:nuclear speckle splicing regulatory protein 1-like n=1 Tax=Dufourea novaeangliae TaxID=178035 RepID=UPI00076788A4|nr:PREDICTED: nuclear speckle splicing regulatory protein 1-like [Dufourea novaeangliae]